MRKDYFAHDPHIYNFESYLHTKHLNYVIALNPDKVTIPLLCMRKRGGCTSLEGTQLVNNKARSPSRARPAPKPQLCPITQQWDPQPTLLPHQLSYIRLFFATLVYSFVVS